MHFVWDERFREETLLQVMFKKSMYISCTFFFLSKTFDMDKGNNASSQKRISVIHIISLSIALVIYLSHRLIPIYVARKP